MNRAAVQRHGHLGCRRQPALTHAPLSDFAVLLNILSGESGDAHRQTHPA